MSMDHPRPPEYKPVVNRRTVDFEHDLTTKNRLKLHTANTRRKVLVQLPAGSNADFGKKTAAELASETLYHGNDAKVVIRIDKDIRKVETGMFTTEELNNDPSAMSIVATQNERVRTAIDECTKLDVPFHVILQEIVNSELEVRYGIHAPKPELELPEHDTFVTVATCKSLQERMGLGAIAAMRERHESKLPIPDVYIVNNKAPIGTAAKFSEWLSLQLSRHLHRTGGPDAVVDHVEGRGRLADAMAVAQHLKVNIEENGMVKGPLIWAWTVREYLEIRKSDSSKNDDDVS